VNGFISGFVKDILPKSRILFAPFDRLRTGFDPSTGSGQVRFDKAQRRLRDGAKTPRLLRMNGIWPCGLPQGERIDKRIYGMLR
jgi:hypothetical protein